VGGPTPPASGDQVGQEQSMSDNPNQDDVELAILPARVSPCTSPATPTGPHPSTRAPRSRPSSTTRRPEDAPGGARGDSSAAIARANVSNPIVDATARRSVWTSLWKEPAKHVQPTTASTRTMCVLLRQLGEQTPELPDDLAEFLPRADSPPRHLQRPAQVLPETGVNPRRATAAGPRPAARSARPEPQRHTLISPPGDHQAGQGGG